MTSPEMTSPEMTLPEMTVPAFVGRYDGMMLAPPTRALYGGDFYNVGDWTGAPPNLNAACAALVRRHLAFGPAATGEVPARILDAGCGLGGGTALLAEAFPGAQVTGINLSPSQLAVARRNAGGRRMSFLVMDATRMALADGCVDLVVSVEAAFHFSPRAAFLAEAWRVLRPGGLMVLTDIVFTGRPWVADWSVPAENHLDGPQDYPALCRAAGFVPEAMADITEATWRGFCRHVRDHWGAGAGGFADQLNEAVSAYLIVRLRKPA